MPGAPTFHPTLATLPPTFQPTVDPFPYQTSLTFAAELRILGIDRASFLADAHLSTAVTVAFASILHRIEAESVTILSVTEATTRRYRRLRSSSTGRGVGTVGTAGRWDASSYSGSGPNATRITSKAGSVTSVQGRQIELPRPAQATTGNRSQEMTMLDSAVLVELQVRIILEILGFTIADSDLVYGTLSAAAVSAVTGGTYITALNNKLLDYGSDAFVSVDSSAFTVGSYTTAVVKTPSPTRMPSSAPALLPTIARSTSGRGGDRQAVTIIVIVSVIGSVAILVSLVVGAYYEREAKRLQRVQPAEEAPKEGDAKKPDMVAVVPA